MATISVGRSRAQQLERRRQRIELVHELAAKKRISRAEIARRLGVSPSTVYRDLRRAPPPSPRARRDLAAQHRVEQREQLAFQVRELREQGQSQNAIAARLGVSRWVVRSDLSDRPKRAWRRADLLERDRRARALHADGMKIPDIAHELGVSAATIYKDLSPGDSREGQRRAAEVRRRVARGQDKLKIAKRLKLSASAVYRVPNAPHISLPQRFGPRAKALRAQGLSLAEIERKLKTSRTTVKRALATTESVVHHRRAGKRSPERQRALKVTKLLAAGVPKTRIAKRLKMGLHTIYRVIRLEAAGRPVAIRSKRKPDARRVRKLFNQGKSKREIARRLGMSATTVRLLLGGELPPVPPDRAQRVRDLDAAGNTKSAIAKEIRMSLSDVYRVLPAPPPPKESVATQRAQPRGKPRAMTVERFAKEHGVRVESVREEIEQKKIRSIEIGKTVLIPHTEAARLLREAYQGLSGQNQDVPPCKPATPSSQMSVCKPKSTTEVRHRISHRLTPKMP
jgi:DNA invertase Pin-like site-specific DNA recombinase